MARLLARLRDFGIKGLSPSLLTWSQRVCEQVEAQFTSIQAQIDEIAAAAKTAIVIDPFNTVLIFADVNGIPKTGELPRDEPITASNGTADITTAGTWSITDPNGITCTIGASTGILNITALDVDEVWVPVTFTYQGVTRSGRVHVLREDDPPTNAGSTGTGGSTASTSTLGDTTGTTYDAVNAVSGVLTVTAGSAGQVSLSAPVSFKRNSITNNGMTHANGKWQAYSGGVWTDIGGDAVTSQASQTIGGSATTGQINCTNTITGLTAGTSYQYRFLWCEVQDSGIGAALYRTSGVLTATGS